MAKRKKGSSILGILLGIVIVLAIGGGLFAIVNASSKSSSGTGADDPGDGTSGDGAEEPQTWGEYIWSKLPDIPGIGEDGSI